MCNSAFESNNFGVISSWLWRIPFRRPSWAMKALERVGADLVRWLAREAGDAIRSSCGVLLPGNPSADSLNRVGEKGFGRTPHAVIARECVAALMTTCTAVRTAGNPTAGLGFVGHKHVFVAVQLASAAKELLQELSAMFCRGGSRMCPTPPHGQNPCCFGGL
jgi:hypothetical protein